MLDLIPPDLLKGKRFYVWGSLVSLVSYFAINLSITPARIYMENREMARKVAAAGYPPSLDYPTLPGGFGDAKEHVRLYQEAKKKGITLTTFETDYIGIKDQMIAERTAAKSAH